MADERFTSVRNTEILQQIQKRLVSGNYSASAYERDVTRLLSQLFPFSVLPGIRLFSSEPRGRIDYGFEMDNLFHLRFAGVDYVVIVEAKNQPVRVEKSRWLVSYDGTDKCARDQADNHIRTMWEYLEPVAKNTELKFFAIVVSSDSKTIAQKAAGYRNAEMHLCSINALPELLAARFNFKYAENLPRPEVLRVPQSRFLDLLRLGLPVEELGHPELASAIKYVDRCRRTLDETLFQRFEPKPERWVINGSAGMGKSVLLAYAAAVLSSGHELYRALGETGVKKATETFVTMGFDSDPKRGAIAVMAMSAKQLENVRGWFNLFVEKFQQADTEGAVRFRPPEFIHCRAARSLSTLGRKWAALLVDEAHDLPPYAAQEIADLYSKGGQYLVVACDRHQKLRLAGSDAKVIEGLDFSNRSTRLRQIYRNPAPVYIASLALMFRWFAEGGPKVIPNLQQLREQFGFDAKIGAEMATEVELRSDAHPANSWSHTVATFPDAGAAYDALIKEKMGHKEVLWVRFSEEDPDFNYEQLIQNFTYHNCRGKDAHKISDKYIKGQDYPIVVIEGFPGFMDRFEANENVTAEAAETQMWAFRRELYLCASRATTFLYFICNVAETVEVLRIRNEIQRLVTATATPDSKSRHGTKSWRFVIRRTDLVRTVDVFADALVEIAKDNTSTEVVQAPGIITPKVIPTILAPPVAPTITLQGITMPPMVKTQGLEKSATADTLTNNDKRISDEIKTAAQISPKVIHIAPSNPKPTTTVQTTNLVPAVSRKAEPATVKSAHPVPVAKPKGANRPANSPILQLSNPITVRRLAEILGVGPHIIIAELMKQKIFASSNQSIDGQVAKKICERRGFGLEDRPKKRPSQPNALGLYWPDSD